MPTIRKRLTSSGKPRYQVQIRRAGYPPITRTFQQLAGAKRWARDVETDLERGHLMPHLEASKHTLGDTLRRYVADGYTAQHSDAHAYNRAGQRKWWADELGDVTLNLLTPAAIIEARSKLIRGKSAATVNHYVNALAAVLDVAVREWQWLEANPCRSVRPFRSAPGRVRFLSDDERQALLGACQESPCSRLYPLVLFALTTGARQSELMRLRWQDINLSGEIPKATLHQTKNRSRRVLSFPAKAAVELRQLHETPHITGYVFATALTTVTPPAFPQKFWQEALEASGVRDFRWHDLRHTAASYLAMSGASLAELAAFLGHRSLASVARYSHIAESHSVKVAAKMAKQFLS